MIDFPVFATARNAYVMAENELESAKREAEAVAPSSAEAGQAISDHAPLQAAMVYEIIQREGSGELSRGASALWWSGVAAGLAIGFSVIAEALLAAHLPDAPWKPLVDNLGYSVGFLIVILARQQLFTENTLTAVLPVIKRKQWNWVLALLRLWGIVLAANLFGCLLFALFIAFSGVLQPDVSDQVTKIGLHLMANSPSEMFIRGIAAGWLIAALVWILPSSEGSEFLVITLMTYLIALGDFTHVIAGSVEAFYLLLIGEIDLVQTFLHFLLPTLLGNIFGGTVLFGVLSYAQVRDELR
ncbi:MAG: formate/nitrite transporter family protein [Cyanobacteria bacterium J06648_11]